MGSLTGSELLARSLTSQGMDTLFFLMGGPMLETESACLKLGVRAIDTRHEQAAAMMAHAYSRTTRRPGVCMGCSGPGTTNLVTGVANAFVDAAPLIAVGGSSPRVYLGMEAFQEIDQVAIMRPITKWAERVLEARRIPELVATAFRAATSGRPGPVYLDLPGDVLGEAVEEASVPFPARSEPTPRAQGDPAAIAAAVALLARAERPLVIGGSGVWWSDAASAFQTFVDTTGIPFYTTPISRGMVAEDHALAFLNARARAFAEADVLLAVGTRFNYVLQFGRPPRFAADLKVIHVDVNPSQLGANRRVDVPIVGDARAVLEQLVAETRGTLDRGRYAAWGSRLRAPAGGPPAPTRRCWFCTATARTGSTRWRSTRRSATGFPSSSSSATTAAGRPTRRGASPGATSATRATTRSRRISALTASSSRSPTRSGRRSSGPGPRASPRSSTS